MAKDTADIKTYTASCNVLSRFSNRPLSTVLTKKEERIGTLLSAGTQN